jgi:hypothetical protein
MAGGREASHVGVPPGCEVPIMLDTTKVVASALGGHLAITYQRTFRRLDALTLC